MKNFNIEFRRWGSSQSDSHSYNYDDDSFAAFEFLAGPAFLIKQSDDSTVQIGIGLHELMQKWNENSCTYKDHTIGVGIIVNEKLFSSKRFSCVSGIKCVFDFKNSRIYKKDGSITKISTSDYSMFEIEPHILFCFNF